MSIRLQRPSVLMAAASAVMALASPPPKPSGTLAPGCVDAGFTIICTN
ncbi:MAG: hypothetical protein KGN78_05980 [Actinomycetales bacterium]|nr:hypothetical protein [Actinomycetales bacterium]